MFGQCLLSGVGISGVSTGIYAAFTNDKNDPRDRKNEYITIFSIILVVSVLILYLFHNQSESLVKTNAIMGGGGISQTIVGGKPPF